MAYLSASMTFRAVLSELALSLRSYPGALHQFIGPGTLQKAPAAGALQRSPPRVKRFWRIDPPQRTVIHVGPSHGDSVLVCRESTS